ncbi:hypothetical protein QL154_01295 (plasmid) [Escherichia coli]|nr:hypothetical protein QL154_01295 [Escherichia coli]
MGSTKNGARVPHVRNRFTSMDIGMNSQIPLYCKQDIFIFYIQWLIFLLIGNTMKKYHAQKRLNNILKNCLLSAAAQLHRPLSWLCFQMYALLLLQLMDHRKQVTRLGIPFRPEHPYDTHARLLLL